MLPAAARAGVRPNRRARHGKDTVLVQRAAEPLEAAVSEGAAVASWRVMALDGPRQRELYSVPPSELSQGEEGVFA